MKHLEKCYVNKLEKKPLYMVSFFGVLLNLATLRANLLFFYRLNFSN